MEGKCMFMNTIGMQCDNDRTMNNKCCNEHKCLYKKGNYECNQVVTCKSRWYCKEHAEMCRCKSIEGDTQCKNYVYIFSYISGKNFCDEHTCVYPGCNKCGNKEKNRLCFIHYMSASRCEYTISNGRTCREIVSIFDKSKEEKYCDKHKCIIDGCINMICNNNTRWCMYHCWRCEYTTKGEICNNYILATKGMKKNIILCTKHKCKWNGRIYDEEQTCDNKVCDKDSEYCDIHSKISKFRKFEFE